VSLGKLPVLMQTGKLRATLATRHAASMKIWALGLDGRRGETINATVQGESLSLSLDTSRLKSVTPFFEFAVE